MTRGKCDLCESENNVNEIEVCNWQFKLPDKMALCEDCDADEIRYCDNCWRCVQYDDSMYTNWVRNIPYEHDFASDDFRYKVISEFERTLYCDDCRADLFGKNSNWRTIFWKLQNVLNR